MLSCKIRLTTKLFDQVIEKGKVVHSSLFLLRYLHAESDNNNNITKIAAVAPQKIFKKANIRNNIRRKIYNTIRLFQSEIKPGYLVIVFAKNQIIDKDLKEYKENIREIFVKAGLLR